MRLLSAICCLFALPAGVAEPGTRRLNGLFSGTNELSLDQAR